MEVLAGQLDAVRTKQLPRRVNHFLNAIVPGHVALLAAVPRMPKKAFYFDEKFWAASGETSIALHSSFLPAGTLERVAALAANTMGYLERAGVPRSVAMQLTGHKTEAVYRRYAIVAEADLRDGVAKLAALHGQRSGTSLAQSAGSGGEPSSDCGA